jgi:phage tail sheath protein FI
MPPALTFPGVYVQEIPSGVRPITGVATSIAAFVGRTARGPVETPVTVTSFADYERTFGPLETNYPLGFSVRDFYSNGGAIAVIVRAFNPVSPVVAKIEAAKSAHPLKLVAKYPGEWANTLRARIEKSGAPQSLADQLGVPLASLFNLRVADVHPDLNGGQPIAEEVFLNLTLENTARNVRGVIAAESHLVDVDSAALDTAIPDAHDDPLNAGNPWVDPFSSKVTNSGSVKNSVDLDGAGFGRGIQALDHADLFNLLVIPPDKQNGEVGTAVNDAAAAYCKTRRALYIVDPPTGWTSVASVVTAGPTALGIDPKNAQYAAVYFPRVKKSNPLRGDLVESFTASGIIAGVMASTDTTRGVWKAPAGVDAGLGGVQGFDIDRPMSDLQNGQLNPLGINCLRYFPIIGHVIWGARTLRGADVLGDEYKYVPVRRTANFIEESLFRGLKWVVFEPNDEPLWAQIRLNVGAFMQGLFRQGAFQGTSARDAYFVACDKTTTTQNDINLGIVNVVVGFAPLKPAEFVVLKIQQIAGQIQT